MVIRRRLKLLTYLKNRLEVLNFNLEKKNSKNVFPNVMKVEFRGHPRARIQNYH